MSTLTLEEQSAPSTPGANKVVVYPKADGLLYSKDDTGTELPLNSVSSMTSSLGADVNLSTAAQYFDGPSIAQGTSGTWFVSGTVTLDDTAGTGSQMMAKLWDGTTVMASAVGFIQSANRQVAISLSGYITAPAANIRISARDASATTGLIRANTSGNSKDSTITGIRIA